MRVRLAPSWLAATIRSLLFLVATMVIAIVLYAANGPPTLSRKSKFDEFERFAPSLWGGMADLVTESLVLIGVTVWFRLGMKVRLEAKPVSPPTRFE